jgi:UV DNA damage endonuclease
VLGEGGLLSADTRRWQSRPHLRRSLALLDRVFDYLDARDIRMYRLSSAVVPYGTHPDLPELDYRRQIGECAEGLAALGARARRAGVRLSTHPGQYTVLNALDAEVARKAGLDLEQHALLLDAMEQGPEANVVVHVGGAYGDRAGALERWARRYDALSHRARARVVVEHDETTFDIGDVLRLHARTGARVVYDHHHHRCLPAPALADSRDALRAAYATWPAGLRPEVHLSSPRTELRVVERRGRDGGRSTRPAPPLLSQHADFVTPFDVSALVRLLPGPADVMLEAKAKDVALLWVREHLARLDPAVAAAEERSTRAADRAARDATPA